MSLSHIAPATPRKSHHLREPSTSTFALTTTSSSTVMNTTKPPRPPLGRSNTPNLPMSPPPDRGSTKLRGLSLITTRSSLDGDRTTEDVNNGPGPSTPRRLGRGLRSSISYSPAPSRASSFLRELGGSDGSIKEESPISMPSVWTDRDERVEGESSAGRVGSGKETREGAEGRREGVGRKPQTLTDKHSDLLTLIAQRERRVNELRQELAHQEASLQAMKTRWTNFISRSSSIPTPHHPTSTTSSSSSASSSSTSIVSASSFTSSQISTLASPKQEGEAPPSLTGLIQSFSPSEEVVEGGKRFWGQLVKTVSAAAVGTVPVPTPVEEVRREKGEVEGLVGRLDLSGFKTMLPSWANTSLTSPPLPPPRPANASRLPGRGMRDVSVSGSSRSLASSGGGSLVDDDGEERMGWGEGGVMIPEREAMARKVSGRKEKEDGEDRWGW